MSPNGSRGGDKVCHPCEQTANPMMINHNPNANFVQSDVLRVGRDSGMPARESSDGLAGAGVQERCRSPGEGDGGVLGSLMGDSEVKEEDGDEGSDRSSTKDEVVAVDANEKVFLRAFPAPRATGVDGRVEIGVPG